MDSNNEKIKTGDTDQTPSELFYNQFAEKLHEFLETSPNSLILIVPSVRDVISNHCVYPQSPLDVSGLFVDPVSRPDKYLAQLHFGSYILILANQTPAKSLSLFPQRRFICCDQRRCTIPPTKGAGRDAGRRSRVARSRRPTASHRYDGELVSSHFTAKMVRVSPLLPDVGLQLPCSFYPLFPSPLELSHEVNLDISHFEHLALCHEERVYAPDVLIVPSRLKHFSKVRPGRIPNG